MPRQKRTVVEVGPAKGSRTGWQVKVRGKATVQYSETKLPAIAQAKKIAKAAALGQVIVKKENGQFQTEYTYGQDLKRSKG
jgi:hypothetical protein